MKITEYNKIISANWKMNGSMALINEFNDYFINNIEKIDKSNAIIFFPPAPYFSSLNKIIKDYQHIYLGAQDCSAYKNSARTGDISASMINELGSNFVLVGHSERRVLYNETDELVSKKIKRAIEENLNVILCIGENEDEKNKNITKKKLEQQIFYSINERCNPSNTIIAYEPVWSIGSGSLPEVSEIEEINLFIQNTVKDKLKNEDNFKILYGGSVNSKNISNILKSQLIDGVLVGGASLKSKEFIEIVNFNLN